MSRKSLIVVILLLILCVVLAFRMAAAPEDSGVTEPDNQIQPGESFPRDEIPAQPGEGPEGLPTPTV